MSDDFSQGSTPAPRQSYPGADKKLAAGLCAILLPGLGIHKFILEMNTAGIIMLVGTMVCATMTPCLIFPILGAFAFWAISIVEGILYLTKSDEEFYQRYIVDKVEWF